MIGDSLTAQSGGAIGDAFYNENYNAEVHGIPGTTTADRLVDIQAAVGAHPAFLIVALGVNDCLHPTVGWTTEDDANVAAVVHAVEGQRTIWVVPQVCVASIVDDLTNTPIVQARWDLVVVPSDHDGATDGIHLGPTGQVHYANFMLQSVDALVPTP